MRGYGTELYHPYCSCCNTRQNDKEMKKVLKRKARNLAKKRLREEYKDFSEHR